MLYLTTRAASSVTATGRTTTAPGTAQRLRLPRGRYLLTSTGALVVVTSPESAAGVVLIPGQQVALALEEQGDIWARALEATPVELHAAPVVELPPPAAVVAAAAEQQRDDGGEAQLCQCGPCPWCVPS